jgi:hypothetical protein
MKNYIKDLTPEKKLFLSLSLYHSAEELKMAAIKKFHPELTEKEIKEKVRKIFLYARS